MKRRTLVALEFDKVLASIADCASTEAGHAACLAIRPLDDINALHQVQSLFADVLHWADTAFVPAAKAGSSVPVFIPAALPDCTACFNAIENGEATLDVDVLSVIRTILSSARTCTASIRAHAEQWPTLQAAYGSLILPESLLTALVQSMDENGNLRDTASPKLMTIRSEIRSIHQDCLHKTRAFAEQNNIAQYLQDEFMTVSNDRYVFPIKTNFKGRVQGAIHDYSNTGETCYIEPLFLLTLNNRLQELKHEERCEEQKIFTMLTRMVKDNLPLIRDAYGLLVGIDSLLAVRAWSDKTEAVPVSVENDVPIQLIDARHPLLLLDKSIQRQGGPHPLSITLRAQDKALIITGGNAGGKTVCLKTLGLSALMALSGLPVPVGRGSTLPWLPDIHAFIGDEQSLDDHVSTFTAQIDALAGLWDTLSPQSLILLDEFGSGTDPTQGAALAQAVIDSLIERQATVAAATHFPALKVYSLTKDAVRSASVLFDPSTKRPLFTLAYDQVGSSLALDVARSHGLPESVLKRARHYLLIDEGDEISILDRLNALAAEREKEIVQLRRDQQLAQEARIKWRAKYEDSMKRLEQDVQRKANDLMKAWQTGKATARQALKELSQVRMALRVSASDTEAQPHVLPVEKLCPGMNVMHAGLRKCVCIRELDLPHDRAKVEMNGISIWADFSDLRPSAEQSPVRPCTRGAVLHTASQDTSPYMSIDVRGQRAEEATAAIQRFLDRSILSGVPSVEIIHGRGTGALRRAIHSFLKNYPGIATYGSATEDCGGDGATLVTFA